MNDSMSLIQMNRKVAEFLRHCLGVSQWLFADSESVREHVGDKDKLQNFGVAHAIGQIAS